MRVLVDAFGGDNAPVEIIKGCLMAVNKYENFDIELFGDEEIVKSELDNLYKELMQGNNFLCAKKVDIEKLKNRIKITDAKEVITNNESPVEAVKTKKDRSLVKGVETLKNDEDAIGFVSAGSTGAVLTAGFLKLGRMRGIKRPALAPVFPTITGGQVVVVDCGANMDSDEYNLLQFAQMGNAYAKNVLKIDNPRIALLSVGVEDKKGNEMTKKAFQLLKQTSLNFVGNMEARDALSGKYDVIVCDGFAGNVLIKSIEGTAEMMIKIMKRSFTKNFKSKMGALLLKDALKEVKGMLDYNAFGGSPFLGAKKIIIKSHGSSKASSICASVKQVLDFNENKLIEKLEKEIVETENNG